jgi:hypothetical protein
MHLPPIYQTRLLITQRDRWAWAILSGLLVLPGLVLPFTVMRAGAWDVIPIGLQYGLLALASTLGPLIIGWAMLRGKAQLAAGAGWLEIRFPYALSKRAVRFGYPNITRVRSGLVFQSGHLYWLRVFERDGTETEFRFEAYEEDLRTLADEMEAMGVAAYFFEERD